MRRFVGTGPYQLTFSTTSSSGSKALRQYWGPQLPNGRHRTLVKPQLLDGLYGAMRSGEVDVLLSTSLEGDQQRSLHRSGRRRPPA